MPLQILSRENWGTELTPVQALSLMSAQSGNMPMVRTGGRCMLSGIYIHLRLKAIFPRTLYSEPNVGKFKLELTKHWVSVNDWHTSILA